MRYTRRKIRKKRFLFPKKKYFPSFYHRSRKILTLTTHDEEAIRNESDYLEGIHLAAKHFNALGFAHFVYLFPQERQVLLGCSFDELAFKEKHLNQILFQKIENPQRKKLGYALTVYIVEIESMPRKMQHRAFVGKPIMYLTEGSTRINAHRRCTLIQVKKNQDTVNTMINFFAEPSSTKRYKRSAVSFNSQQFGAVSVVSVLESLHNPQLIYLITLPLLQGIFECCVDKSQWSPAISALLKVLPRISLIGLGLWSNFQWPVFLFYALFEAHVSTFLESRMDSTIKSLLFFLFFILMTEFEYGFSNLWILAECPRLWSHHSEQFNQLFFQIIWAPLIKMLGYTATLALTESCRSDIDSPSGSQAEETFIGQEGEEPGSPPFEGTAFFIKGRKVLNAPVLSETTRVSITQDNDDVFPKYSHLSYSIGIF